MLGQRARQEPVHASPLLKQHPQLQDKRRVNKGARKGAYEEEVPAMSELKINFKDSTSTTSKRRST
jgi:hypothetical protein